MADLLRATARPRRYLLVGLFCAGLNNVVMIAADLAGIHYAAGVVISMIVTGLVGYALHSLYTFERDFAGARLARFAGGLLAGLPVTLALMSLLCDGIGLPVPIAAPIATVALFFFNYAWARWAIYLHRDQREETP
jgi:putative flippase GtrA